MKMGGASVRMLSNWCGLPGGGSKRYLWAGPAGRVGGGADRPTFLNCSRMCQSGGILGRNALLRNHNLQLI